MRIITTVLLAVPLFSVAQAPPAASAPAAPPADVDRALREQATAFLQYQKEGNFRKAYELVAEDSKDYYLGTNKEKPQSSDIQDIQYSDNFTKAVVVSASKQTLPLLGRIIEIPTGTNDHWKIEDGKWKWYHDAAKEVVMGVLGPMPATATAPDGSPTKLPDLSPQAIAERAAKLPPPKPSFNRKSLPFTVGQESTEELVFHNNSPGVVKVDADLILDYPGFEVEPKRFMLNPQAEAIFKVTYNPANAPSDKGVFNAWLRLTLQPFEREYRIPLKLSPPPAAPKP